MPKLCTLSTLQKTIWTRSLEICSRKYWQTRNSVHCHKVKQEEIQHTETHEDRRKDSEGHKQRKDQEGYNYGTHPEGHQ